MDGKKLKDFFSKIWEKTLPACILSLLFAGIVVEVLGTSIRQEKDITQIQIRKKLNHPFADHMLYLKYSMPENLYI